MEDIIAYLTESRLVIGVITLSLAAIGYALVQWPKKSASSQVAPLPPGPPRQFLIGNLRQFPRDHFHKKFCEWHKLYGELRHFTSHRWVDLGVCISIERNLQVISSMWSFRKRP
jgi:hypothetical protein